MDVSLLTANTLTHKLARGTVVNLSGVVIRIVLVFLHGLVAARLFGAEPYGIYVEGVAVVILLSTAGQLGLSRAVTRFVAMYIARHQSDNVFGTLQVVLKVAVPIAIGAGLVLALGAEPISGIFQAPALTTWFRILGLAVPMLTLCALFAAFTQGFQRMRHKVIALDIVTPMLELIFVVLLAAWGGGWLSLPLAYTGSLLIAAILLIYFSRVDLQTLESDTVLASSISSRVQLKPILHFSAPVWISEVLMAATARISVLMLGMFAASAAVGIFGVAQRLVGLGGVFLLSINLMFGPMVTDVMERQQRSDLNRLYKVSTRWILMFSLPIFLLLAYFRENILDFYGPEFASGADVLLILTAGVILDLSTGTSGTILIMSGHPKYNAFNEFVRLGVIIGLGLVLVPNYGMVGAAWSIAIGTAVFSAMQLVEVWWHFHMVPYSKSVLKVLIACLVMILILWAWPTYLLDSDGPWYFSLIGAGSASVLYAVTIVVLGLESNEAEILRVAWKRLAQALSRLHKAFSSALL